MSYRNKFLAATIALAALPAAFAGAMTQGPVSADGAPLTPTATAAASSQMNHERTLGTMGAAGMTAQRHAAVSADGSPLTLQAPGASAMTRQQVQAEARTGRTMPRDATSLPLIGLNG